MKERKLVTILEKGQWLAVRMDSVKDSLGRCHESRDFKRTERRLELPDAANKNTGHLVKFAFQINNTHIH